MCVKDHGLNTIVLSTHWIAYNINHNTYTRNDIIIVLTDYIIVGGMDDVCDLWGGVSPEPEVVGKHPQRQSDQLPPRHDVVRTRRLWLKMAHIATTGFISPF